jgi:signal peptidase I
MSHPKHSPTKPTAAAASAPAKPKENEPAAAQHGYRETIESVIVAFILAFLFRAFVAEAFVIPTGSMAPTLMGAHKDVVCEHCGALYQSTASHEFNQETQQLSNNVAVASNCAKCRGYNAFDLAGNRNHATFSGDRILVSKFDYVFGQPQRWDVLVFKYPDDARLNYIKRLVGMPGEQLLIQEGDVYVRTDTNQPWHLARKPAHKVMPMLQVVSDTQHQPDELVSRGWPSLWQPLPATGLATGPGVAAGVAAGVENPWQLVHEPGLWRAELPPAADSRTTQWLRYYHKYLDNGLWRETRAGQPLEPRDPHSSTLITDYLAYNTTEFATRQRLYPEGRLRSDITTANRAAHVVPPDDLRYEGLRSLPQDGMHWVGDLAVEFDVEVQGNQGAVSVDLVEFGLHYRCSFDAATGSARLQAFDGDQPIDLFIEKTGAGAAGAGPAGAGPVVPQASSVVRGGGRYRITFANVDDQLFVWVNGRLLQFDHPTTFDSHRFRTGADRRPYWSEHDPLDAAPIGLGGAGVGLKVHRAQVWRDIYYIAIRAGNNFTDFNDGDLYRIIDSIPDPELRRQMRFAGESMAAVSWIYARPEMWAETELFARRGKLEFSLGPDDFFPMGDNSAASSDARAWTGHNYVERRFLVGKALLVFWPHPWVSPFPYPNFGRMGRIR